MQLSSGIQETGDDEKKKFSNDLDQHEEQEQEEKKVYCDQQCGKQMWPIKEIYLNDQFYQ